MQPELILSHETQESLVSDKVKLDKQLTHISTLFESTHSPQSEIVQESSKVTHMVEP